MTDTQTNAATRMGFRTGQIVHEVGYDDDADQGLRDSITDATGRGLLAADGDELPDAVLLWHRGHDDQDLADVLGDLAAQLADGGMIWLCTPVSGRPGSVERDDLADATATAGLTTVESFPAAPGWAGTRLANPRTPR